MISLNDRVSELQEILNANINNYTIDLFDIMEMQAVSDELALTTDTSLRPILPSDLSTTKNILSTIIEWVTISLLVHYVHSYNTSQKISCENIRDA